MTAVRFDYEEWDDDRDVLLHRPGSTLGFGVVNASAEYGKYKTGTMGSNNRGATAIIDSIIGNIAGSLEWLRWYGLSPTDVQSKVRAYLREAQGTERQVVLKASLQASADVSDQAGVLHRVDTAKFTR